MGNKTSKTDEQKVIQALLKYEEAWSKYMLSSSPDFLSPKWFKQLNLHWNKLIRLARKIKKKK
jgi:hypothetical protein